VLAIRASFTINVKHRVEWFQKDVSSRLGQLRRMASTLRTQPHLTATSSSHWAIWLDHPHWYGLWSLAVDDRLIFIDALLIEFHLSSIISDHW
jgi:hypothetical protein